MSYALIDDDILQLCCAVRMRDISDVKMLLEFVPYIDCPDTNGETVVHTAVLYDCKDIVEELIDMGADVNISNKNGQTPLHIAVNNGHFDVTKLLIDAHADIDTTTKYSEMTPLHLAAMNGHTDIVKLLLEHGADCNALDQIKKTPEFYAANGEITSILRDRKMKQKTVIETQQNLDEDIDIMQKYLKPSLEMAKYTFNKELLNISPHKIPENSMTDDLETADKPKANAKEMSIVKEKINEPKVTEKSTVMPDISEQKAKHNLSKQTNKENTPKSNASQRNQTTVVKPTVTLQNKSTQRFGKAEVQQKLTQKNVAVKKAVFQQNPVKVKFSASHEKMMQMNVFDRLTRKKSQLNK